MSKKLQLALLALLGFSTACSTVKNAPAKNGSDKEASKTEESQKPEGQEEETTPSIRVLYGVRLPPEEQERIRQQTLEHEKAAREEQKSQTEQSGTSETAE